MGHSRGSRGLGLPEQASGGTVMSKGAQTLPPQTLRLRNITVHAAFDSVGILSWVLAVGLFMLAVGGRSNILSAAWVILGAVCILGGCYVVYLAAKVHPVSVERSDFSLRVR